MTTQGDGEPTQAEQLITWHRVLIELDPHLDYCRAGQRIVTIDDVGKSVKHLVTECLEARYREITK